ncbi:GL2-INTERACTING REPRESSOR 2-like protein [Drosera capensis]
MHNNINTFFFHCTINAQFSSISFSHSFFPSLLSHNFIVDRSFTIAYMMTLDLQDHPSLLPNRATTLGSDTSGILHPLLSTSSTPKSSFTNLPNIFCISRNTGEESEEEPVGRSEKDSNSKLDLNLNLSPHRKARNSIRPASLSPPSSCLTREEDIETRDENNPEVTSMILAGCPRCLMYVMLSEKDAKCPNCKSTVLVDFLHDTSYSVSSKTEFKTVKT